jgi:uncharacterized protein involved in exopolysaccharide biosynthesis
LLDVEDAARRRRRSGPGEERLVAGWREGERGDDLELGFWVSLLRRHAVLVLAVALAFVSVAFVASLLSAPSYRASAEVLLSPVAESTSSGPGVVAADEARLAGTDYVLSRAYARAGSDVTLEAAAEDGSNLLSLTATAATPARAAAAANAYADVYVELRSTQAAQQHRDDAAALTKALAAAQAATPRDDAQVQALTSARNDALVQAQLAQTSEARVVARALPPSSPSSAGTGTYVTVGAAVGLVLGLVLAGALDAVRRPARGPQPAAAAEELDLGDEPVVGRSWG